MGYLKSKGVILQQKISGSFTAVAQVESISFSGAQSETMELRPLDATDAGVIHISNGWIDGGSITFGLLYDSSLAGHKAITTALSSMASTDWKVLHTDGGSTATSFTSGGIGFNEEIQAISAIRANVTLKATGLVTWPT